MQRRTLIIATLGAIAACLLSACAPTTEVLRSTREARLEQPVRSLLVAGVSTDDRVRRAYEQAFVRELQRAGLAGTASTDFIPTLDGLTMPQIRERMHALDTRADAVLHVQLVELGREPTWSPQDIPAEQAPASGALGSYSVTLNAPPEGAVRGSRASVELSANLYALPDRRLLWTGITATREANDPAAVGRSHARALIPFLRKRGYLPPAP